MKSKFHRKVLKNGMTIILEKRETPVVSVAFAVRCGGMNEAAGEKGISHFIEHLLYKGTETRSSRKIAEEIEKKGGILNGFTDETITAYWCKMPSRHLDVALNVLSDMVKNSLFDGKEIEKERHVIFEEMKMYKDNPLHYVLEKMQGSLYEEPLGIPLIGTEKTLNSLTREKIIKRFGEIYNPKNLILCVVGDAEFEVLVDFAEKNFSDGSKIVKKVPSFKIVKRNQSGSEKRNGIDQASLVFAHHVPLLKTKGSYASCVLNVIMAGGMSSRLFQEIREKRNLAYGVKGDSEVNIDFAYNFIYVGTKKENVEPVKKLIVEEFEKVSKELTEEELNQVKEEIIGNLQISTEDSQTQMVSLLHYEICGDAKDFYELEEKIKEVELDEVKKVAKNAAKDYSFFALLPE
ncbi:MAG: insulinase family protein [Nanoarchaeota archaeon]|nr:insulinase family protein [Nanoarchaeota archaeon]